MPSRINQFEGRSKLGEMAVSKHPVRGFSHVAVCISDLDISKTFYSKALGFTIDHDVAAGEPYGKLVELQEFAYRASFLVHNDSGVMVELLSVDSPGHIGSKERRAMNRLGITHLSFIVDDADSVGKLIEQYGGKALWETKVGSAHGDILFCTDPDGTRIELWAKPA